MRVGFTTVLRALGLAGAAALLTSCGGEELVAFNPTRILVFGDQASVITPAPIVGEGRKYTVNAVTDTGTVVCQSNPLWVQILASGYGMGFPECPNSVETAEPKSRILAKAGATASGSLESDLAGQITRQLALPAADGGGIGEGDLVTVYVGLNDIVALYKLYELGASADEVAARAEQAGIAIATQVARIADAGGKVIVSTVPDAGVTPYARSKDIAGADLLRALTIRVNNQFLLALQNTGYNDGRRIGLIELNPYLINVVANPLGYGYTDVLQASCVPVDPLECTSQTLQEGATSYTWLWATETQLSPGAHFQLGNLALTRARNQPF